MTGFPSGVVRVSRVSCVIDVAILGGFELPTFVGPDDSRDVLFFNKFT